jgi:Coenzyme PQQ synthesis protein D (PqqD)
MAISDSSAAPSLDVRLMGASVRVPDHVVYRAFPAETVILNLETGTYHGLNKTGGRMLESLDRLARVKSVAEELANEFDAPLARIQTDLCRLCQELLDRGLIEHHEGS